MGNLLPATWGLGQPQRLFALLLSRAAGEMVAFLGVAVKLFIGEVGAGREAKSQAWLKRSRKAMAVRPGIARLRPGCGLLGRPSWRGEGTRASSGRCPHTACTHAHVHTHLVRLQPPRPFSPPCCHPHHPVPSPCTGGTWQVLEGGTSRPLPSPALFSPCARGAVPPAPPGTQGNHSDPLVPVCTTPTPHDQKIC